MCMYMHERNSWRRWPGVRYIRAGPGGIVVKRLKGWSLSFVDAHFT